MLCCLAGQPSCSNSAKTSPVPPGRQRTFAAPQVIVYKEDTARGIDLMSTIAWSLYMPFNWVSLFRFLSIPKGFSYLNERGYVSKQLDKWQKVFVMLLLNQNDITNKSVTL